MSFSTLATSSNALSFYAQIQENKIRVYYTYTYKNSKLNIVSSYVTLIYYVMNIVSKSVSHYKSCRNCDSECTPRTYIKMEVFMMRTK